jgi:predicted nucleotidyltransferase
LIDLEDFTERVSIWAANCPDILSVVLVGSHARGEARPDSDIDLVILSATPSKLHDDPSWLGEFGNPLQQVREDWGKVQSLRVWYADGKEVEFGITDEGWMKEPLDQGTKKVLKNGYRIIYERTNAKHEELA